MLRPATGCILLATISLLGACSSRPLPKYEKPIARTRVQNVRTTAYTHSEADHIQHGRKTALGTTLQCSHIHSAAADWSRWPAGTVFRIRETGETFQVDDYGWALAGTNTIDLYKPSRAAMNRWGVRRVTIENLVWGDVDRSLSVLRPRAKHKHIRRMIDQIESRYSELKRPIEPAEPVIARAEAVTPPPAVAPATAAPVRRIEMAKSATPAARPAGAAAATGVLVPFSGGIR